MTTKRRPAGRGSMAAMGNICRSIACTHGPQARKRSATDWSVMHYFKDANTRATSRSHSMSAMGTTSRSIACTHGPQPRKRSATDWSVMDSYKDVKVPATSRKDLSKPQYKKITRKSCAGVFTFFDLTKALHVRAL